MKKSNHQLGMVVTILFVAISMSCQTSKNSKSESSSPKKEPQMENQNPFYGKTIQHTWTEGPFAGGSFKNTYNKDNTARLECVAGQMKGLVTEQKLFSSRKLNGNIWLMSWLEDSGYSVSIAFDFDAKKVTGTISKPESEFYPVIGTIDSVQ